jgi:hypothetical protein
MRRRRVTQAIRLREVRTSCGRERLTGSFAALRMTDEEDGWSRGFFMGPG